MTLQTYLTIHKIKLHKIGDSGDYDEIIRSGEFYILPMLRFLSYQKHMKTIQFRWLIFGININFNY